MTQKMSLSSAAADSRITDVVFAVLERHSRYIPTREENDYSRGSRTTRSARTHVLAHGARASPLSVRCVPRSVTLRRRPVPLRAPRARRVAPVTVRPYLALVTARYLAR